jgi:hypothetical protein
MVNNVIVVHHRMSDEEIKQFKKVWFDRYHGLGPFLPTPYKKWSMTNWTIFIAISSFNIANLVYCFTKCYDILVNQILFSRNLTALF